MALTFGGGERESQAAAQAQAQARAQAQAAAQAQAQAAAQAQAQARAQAQAAAQAQAQAAAQAQAPSGMLTGMTAQEVLDILPGPGSYYYNLYKAENPELVAAAEAIRNEARAASKRGEAPSQPVGGGLTFGGTAMPTAASSIANPVVVETNNSFAIPNVSLSNTNTDSTTAVEPAMSYDERRYLELLGRGVIDEQGNILKPQGLNPTEIMRGEPPSWATPELIKNAYIQAFESKARGGQNFMESGDYQNFLDAGYSLTQDQINALGGVQGQGSQDDLTFGGGQTATGVANPPPTVASESDAQQQQLNQNFIKFLEELGLGSLVTAFQSGTTPDLSGIGMMSGGNSGGSSGGSYGGSYTPYVPLMPTVAPIDFTASVLPKNTVGYDPVRGLYNIPDAQTQQTVTEQTGLFNYIYGPQG